MHHPRNSDRRPSTESPSGRSIMLAHRVGIVVEGAGAVAAAVALSHSLAPGPVVCIVSGANLDPGVLAEILTG
jgi:threonine dehydratase